MAQEKKDTDQEIMARLRAPIDDLVDRFCPEKTQEQRVRLRQLAWQAVDVLVRTGNVAGIQHDPNIKRISRNIKELGASDFFVEESLRLAMTIYRNMKVDYPGLLQRYGR